MPVDHLRRSQQIHKQVEGEEVVTVVSDKGDSSEVKIDHVDKKIFVKAGPEEDGVWKFSNGSYEALMTRLGRSADGQPVASGIQSSKPIESVPVVPEFAPPTDLGD